MNLKKLLSEGALALLLASCAAPAQDAVVKPITGTWVNLAWKDVRNQYTNPLDVDMTRPELWRAKVGEWHDMGLEYLILMEVANEGTLYYGEKDSPVSVILEEAGRHGMKVLLSTGWAENQDDDLRRPEIRERQQQIMQELTDLYKDSPAFWGWYLPVEDCITPVFPRTAVDAVNTLVERARELTPGKKTLISPYGMVYADYDNPEFAANIRALKVDIIAYQDEIGCVREPFPLPRLRENWKKLRQVHEGTAIEMWANCETFTWEGNTNDRTSALIPAAYARLLAQQVAASEGGVSRIVSFMFDGIIEQPSSPYRLGQGEASVTLWRDYSAWRAGDPYWKRVEASLRGDLCGMQGLLCTDDLLLDGVTGEECPDDTRWSVYNPGLNTVSIALPDGSLVERLGLRALDCAQEWILPPERISVYGADGALLAIQLFTPFANNRHDTWVDYIDIPLKPVETSQLTLVFETDHPVCLDELYVFGRPGTVPPKESLRSRLQALADSGRPAYGHQDDLVYGHAWTVTDLETDPLDRSDIKAVCGAWPMVAGFELGGIEKGDSASLDGVPFQLIRRAARIHAARGGIVTLSWHPDNPLTGGSTWDVGTDGVVAFVLEGGQKHELFMQWLGRAADFIGSLGIPVIFRPWHENTAGWFWWGNTLCTAAQYRDLYRMTWDYFTRERGLHDILWCYSPTGDAGPEAFMATYPGDDIIDILGMDTYEFIPDGKSLDEAGEAFTGQIRDELTYISALAAEHHKLLALTETGLEGIPDPMWWTLRLAPAISGFPLTYVLTWRNAHDRAGHFYGPWEGYEGDFYDLKESGCMTFLEPQFP